MLVKVYTDGAARGNPDGPGGYGAVLEYVDGKGQLHTKELSQKGEQLLREANQNGGKDNISAILIEPEVSEE